MERVKQSICITRISNVLSVHLFLLDRRDYLQIPCAFPKCTNFTSNFAKNERIDLSKCEEALVGERSVNKFGSISLVLKGVVELRIAHAHNGGIFGCVVTQLLLPRPLGDLSKTTVRKVVDNLQQIMINARLS